MTETKFTPGPWELVEATEHHGPYVAGSYGGTVCDCYVMSQPALPSMLNGGPSKPLPFANADANARLIAAAPELYEAGSELMAARAALDVTPTSNGKAFDAEMARHEQALVALSLALAKATLDA